MTQLKIQKLVFWWKKKELLFSKLDITILKQINSSEFLAKQIF
jgi:hypothetical protein